MKEKALGVALAVCITAALSACDWFAEETPVPASADREQVEPAIQSVDGDPSVDIETDSGEFELTNEKGTTRIATGKDAAIPKDFPKDVPLYPGFKPTMVQSLPGGTVALAGSVQASIPAVKSHYDRTARKNGWAETGSIAEQHVASLSYTKGDRMLQVTATPDLRGTMLSITTGKN